MSKDSKFSITTSKGFAAWLAANDVSLAFSTYQAGKLFLIGRKSSGELSVCERTFERCMGVWTNAQTILLATTYQLWRLENKLSEGQADGVYDKLYVPTVGYTTGSLDVHDVVMDAAGEITFVNTRFSCLATVSERSSFRPTWRPGFIKDLTPADCCHLNGLAMVDGRPGYVTVCGTTSEPEGWRSCRRDGGRVLSVETGEAVCEGLSMPHSPRWHDDRLWVLNSGGGYLGLIDLQSRVFEPVALCPGFARGLAFVGRYAVIGLSLPRRGRSFDGLPLNEQLQKHSEAPRCGLQVVDTQTAETVAWLTIEGVVDELYDVAALPGVVAPSLYGFKTPDIARNVWVDEGDTARRWSAADGPEKLDEPS